MKNNESKMTQDLLYYERLVQFQGEMMEHLYDDHEVVFGLITEYLSCSQLICLTCDEKGIVDLIVFQEKNNQLEENEITLNMTVGRVLQIGRNLSLEGEEIPAYLKDFMAEWGVPDVKEVATITGQVNQTMYAMLFCRDDSIDLETAEKMEYLVINNIKIGMENRIYHNIVTYESNHDLLTRLYNRRCYFQRSQEEYPLLASIGIFYFDVNNLKTVNDCYGHDAGDALLQKAAESIRSITSENVHGYRMGGDEFIVVAMNCTQTDMETIIKKWEKELDVVNEKYGGDPCVIAVGTAYAKGSFQIEELCQLADKRMYQDKQQKKRKGMG